MAELALMDFLQRWRKNYHGKSNQNNRSDFNWLLNLLIIAFIILDGQPSVEIKGFRCLLELLEPMYCTTENILQKPLCLKCILNKRPLTFFIFLINIHLLQS